MYVYLAILKGLRYKLFDATILRGWAELVPYISIPCISSSNALYTWPDWIWNTYYFHPDIGLQQIVYVLYSPSANIQYIVLTTERNVVQ